MSNLANYTILIISILIVLIKQHTCQQSEGSDADISFDSEKNGELTTSMDHSESKSEHRQKLRLHRKNSRHRPRLGVNTQSLHDDTTNRKHADTPTTNRQLADQDLANPDTAEADDGDWLRLEAMTYIRKIFHKYGEDDVLDFEAFEHLMEELGLGKLVIAGHNLEDHKIGSNFIEFHPSHTHVLPDNIEHEESRNEDHQNSDYEHSSEEFQDSDSDHHGDHDHGSDESHNSESDHHSDRMKRSLNVQHDHNHDVYDKMVSFSLMQYNMKTCFN